jgi:hypothetical protein
MIAANTFGSGVTDILDLSGNNNPFSQATPSSRGAWFREPKTGRRNLLERTQEFNDAYWSKGSGSVVTANQDTAPDGSLTADRVTSAVAITGVRLDRTVTCTPNTTYTFSFWCKNIDKTSINYRISTTGDVAIIAATDYISQINTSTYTRISVTFTTPAVNTDLRVFIDTSSSAGSFLVWGAQLELGSTATAYQRVTTAFDVTEAGQRDCYGVRFDGTDDGYGTSSIDFSANDTISVFAAFRKLGDLATGALVELTGNSANAGAFGVLAPSSAGANNIQFRSTGSTTATSAAGVAGPVTYVGSFLRQISTDTNIMRLNGTQVATSATDQGTGNNATGSLNLGFRNGGASNFLNGNLYALIVAGGSYPLSTIQRVERLLSRITPTVNL